MEYRVKYDWLIILGVDHMTFGEKVLKLRTDNNLSQEKLAEKIMVS